MPNLFSRYPGNMKARVPTAGQDQRREPAVALHDLLTRGVLIPRSHHLVRKFLQGSLASLLICASAAAAGDVTGTWSGNPFYLVIKQDGAKLSGTGGPGKKSQVVVEDGRVEGDRLTFRLGPFRFDLRVIAPDEIKGEAQGPSAPLAIYLKRLKETPADSAKPLAFDVASMKRSPPFGPGTRVDRKFTPGRFTCSNATLRNLIMGAYSLEDYQISGPGWLDSVGYDIIATMPPSTSSDDAMLMIQSLVTDRLKLKIHRETHELPVYALLVGKGGLKAKEVEWTFGGVSSSRGRLVSKSTTMESLATILSRQLDRPVLNMTGIKGHYDVRLEWTPEGQSTPDGPSIFTAIQDQLGLKLEARKAPIEMIVVDHAEKDPSEN